jgi:hypothetical protein
MPLPDEVAMPDAEMGEVAMPDAEVEIDVDEEASSSSAKRPAADEGRSQRLRRFISCLRDVDDT